MAFKRVVNIDGPMEDFLPVYLPIANLSVNGLLIVMLGAMTGVLSGLFGVGGGFLTTPY